MKILSLYDYLNEIRDSHEDHYDSLKKTGFWGKAGAGVIFLAKDTKRLLLAHRSHSVEQPDTFGVWGGAIDYNESPEVAAAEEAYEEAGVEVSPDDLILLYVFQKESFKYYTYLCIVEKEFEPELNWETQDFVWFEYGDWPFPLHFGIKEILKDKKAVSILKETIDSL